MIWIKVKSPDQITGEYETILLDMSKAYMVSPSRGGYGKIDVWMDSASESGAISLDMTVDELYGLIKETSDDSK